MTKLIGYARVSTPQQSTDRQQEDLPGSGRSTQNGLAFADELRDRGAGLRVLNLGGGDGPSAMGRAAHGRCRDDPTGWVHD